MQNRNRFGLLAKDYAAHRRGYPQEVYRVIQEHVPKGAVDALYVGCGTGVVTYELAKFCYSVIGTDKEKEMIELAQANAQITALLRLLQQKVCHFPILHLIL